MALNINKDEWLARTGEAIGQNAVYKIVKTAKGQVGFISKSQPIKNLKELSIRQIDEITAHFLKTANDDEKKGWTDLRHKTIKARVHNDPNGVLARSVKNFLSKISGRDPALVEAEKKKKGLQEIFHKTGLFGAQKEPQLLAKVKEGVVSERQVLLEKTLELSSTLRSAQKEGGVSISPFVREPLENPQKAEGVIEPEKKIAQCVSYERFRSTLRRTFCHTVSTILEAPPSERSYVVIADESKKSTNWVASQLLDLMTIHPPQAIIPWGHIQKYLSKHPEVKHVVMVDDGAYSGDQLSGNIRSKLDGVSENLTFHVNVPFTTKSARKKIQDWLPKSIPRDKLIFPQGQQMLTNAEWNDFGFFGYHIFNRPDVEKLLSIVLIDPDVDSLKDVKEATIKFNKEFEVFRSTIFKIAGSSKGIDLKIIEKIDSFLDRLQALLQSIDVESEGRKGLTEFMETLESIKVGVDRPGFDPRVSEEQKYRYFMTLNYKGDFPKLTPFWMAHKSADGSSTDVRMMTATFPQTDPTSLRPIIEPYKNDLNAPLFEKQVARLQQMNPGIVTQWRKLTDQTDFQDIQIVQSNRGVFLLGDNYIPHGEKKRNMQIIDRSSGLKIPFGGDAGAYQFKLREGMLFSIILEGKESPIFELREGTLYKTC